MGNFGLANFGRHLPSGCRSRCSSRIGEAGSEKLRASPSPGPFFLGKVRRPFVIWSNLKCEHGNGSWVVIDGIVFVKTCYGSKATQLGGSNPEGLARILIRELAGMRTRWLC